MAVASVSSYIWRWFFFVIFIVFFRFNWCWNNWFVLIFFFIFFYNFKTIYNRFVASSISCNFNWIICNFYIWNIWNFFLVLYCWIFKLFILHYVIKFRTWCRVCCNIYNSLWIYIFTRCFSFFSIFPFNYWFCSIHYMSSCINVVVSI